MSGLPTDPINNITWRLAGQLEGNFWNPNRVHRDELKLLEFSLLSTGWLQPILVNRELTIIDGFHRWRLSQDSPEVKARWKGMVPTATLDVDRPTAMALTVRINRAKGTHVAAEMSKLAREVIGVHGWTVERLAGEIGADRAEVELLLAEDVFAAKQISQWAYSQAWYPSAEGTG